MSTPRPILNLSGAALLALCMTSCSSNSNPVPTNPPGTVCSVGTQVQLSNPLPNSSGVPTTIGQVQIVVNANTDLLGSSWNTYLVDFGGNKIQGGTLKLTTNPGGPHPFPNNYYYNSTIPQLTFGDSYNVYINQFTSQCTPALVGSFGT
jgi:hypothetical protein